VPPEEDLSIVGWYCWRCERINGMACRSDCVPIYVPKEWEQEFTWKVVEQ